ncbi:MAG: hypothetical protein J2P57_25070, partial [Acidimicrobiaceae bacterium]|nr:hypothetical protein [Acidimicrobiaceae bacterium]
MTEEHTAETTGPEDKAPKRQTKGRYRRSGGVAVLAAAAAVALAACGGGHRSPQVANLPTTS